MTPPPDAAGAAALNGDRWARRRQWVKRAAGVASGAALVAIYFACDPVRSHFPACPFHMVTGLYCPGCGGQRAVHHILHGHVSIAMHDNALLCCAAPAVGVGLGRPAVAAAGARRIAPSAGGVGRPLDRRRILGGAQPAGCAGDVARAGGMT